MLRFAQKNGADGLYEFPSAQKLRIPIVRPRAQVTAGYFGDLAVAEGNRYYYFIGGKLLLQLGCLGGHVSIGPPSRAGTFWTKAVTNVPTNPTIRIEILTARFMGSLSYSRWGVPPRVFPVWNFFA